MRLSLKNTNLDDQLPPHFCHGLHQSPDEIVIDACTGSGAVLFKRLAQNEGLRTLRLLNMQVADILALVRSGSLTSLSLAGTDVTAAALMAVNWAEQTPSLTTIIVSRSVFTYKQRDAFELEQLPIKIEFDEEFHMSDDDAPAAT